MTRDGGGSLTAGWVRWHQVFVQIRVYEPAGRVQDCVRDAAPQHLRPPKKAR